MSIESRIAALLRSPRALGFLAALSGRDVSQVPRLADVGFTPVTSWTVDIEEPLPPTPPADADGRQHELSPQFSAILDDPFSLVTLAASTVSDWSWNPRARAAQRYLLRNADSYHLLAQYLSTSTASDWWWGPVELTRQTIVSSATNRPSIDQAEKLAKAHLCSGSPKLFHGAMLTSSTSLGAQLPAVQLCDPDVTHRLREPVHCWRATIDSDARVCELGRPSDWLRLCERYPLSYPPPVEWRSWGVRARAGLGVNWFDFAEDWDGLHISMAGVLTATDLPLLVGADASVFSDVCTEMTVWFRNRITDITFLAEWNDGSPEANLS